MKSTPAKYARDPAAFAATCFAALGLAMQRCQVEHAALVALDLVAVAFGKRPPVGKHWIEATKGWGKSLLLAIYSLWLVAYSDRAQTAQVGAKDYDQADEIRRWWRQLLQVLPWLSDRVSLTSWKLECKANGSDATILTADNTGAHGSRPTLLILDELVHIDREEFAQSLLDNAAKMPCGLVLVGTNAGFTNTWQWTLREIARSSPGRWSFTAWTQTPPHQDPADIEEAKRRRTRTNYLRMFECVWASGGGDALATEDIKAAVKPGLSSMLTRERGYGFCAGLDLGIKHDRSGLVVLGCHARTQRIRLAECRGWAPVIATGKVDLSAVEQAAYVAWKIFRCPISYDPWQCELMAQRLRKVGVEMIEVPFVGQNLNRMASDLLDVFRSQRIDLYPDADLIRDLGRLTIVEKSYGYKLESTRDADGHADRATGLALSLLGVPDAMCRPAEPWYPINARRGQTEGGPNYYERPQPGVRFGPHPDRPGAFATGDKISW